MVTTNYTPEEQEKIKMGRPRLYDSPEEMESLINQYVKECRDKDDPITMSGMAYALGMDRKTLVNYSHRDDFLLTVKRARELVEQEYERRLLKAGTPTIGYIFAMKNNMGWVDKQEIESTSRVSLSVPDDVEDTGDKAE